MQGVVNVLAARRVHAADHQVPQVLSAANCGTGRHRHLYASAPVKGACKMCAAPPLWQCGAARQLVPRALPAPSRVSKRWTDFTSLSQMLVPTTGAGLGPGGRRTSAVAATSCSVSSGKCRCRTLRFRTLRRRRLRKKLPEHLPLGVVDVGGGDRPRQRRHARVHRRREGAGVYVMLQQQHLC